ncbi:cyclopropane-fatty-acyl-phospholipid synthase [Candidatus Peregrinibacteria bacterium]|nr:MAG: cyclopropane-fatty-acyl-phospholipid synthase [Candidatus Peregrinibacteria bacterium]
MKFIKNYANTKGAEMLQEAGITVNGSNPWDIHIHNDNFFLRLLFYGTVALGESYVDGWWDVEKLDQFVYKLLDAKLVDHKSYTLQHPIAKILNKLRFLSPLFFNKQNKTQASKDVKYHYNIGNDLFEAMLDKRMNYSCAYWKNAKNLDEAQEAKLDMICKKLKLEPGMSVLEIGCGWGGFAKYAIEKYGVRVRGITLSENQRDYALKYCKGLNFQADIIDYREIQGQYDRVVSIEMIEHVGPKNYQEYFQVIDRCLKKEGLCLIQFDGKSESLHWNDVWIEKYIFPNTVTPSPKQITTAIENLFFIVDWEDFTKDYHTTMMEWDKNIDKNWETLKKNYDERFYRMWKFYLLYCPATALAKSQHLWQVVFQKTDSQQDYYRVDV